MYASVQLQVCASACMPVCVREREPVFAAYPGVNLQYLRIIQVDTLCSLKYNERPFSSRSAILYSFLIFFP